MDARRSFPWLLRVVWVILPFAVGPALGPALHPSSEAVRVAAAAIAWAAWAVVLVGTLVHHPIGLTALRIVAPAATVVAVLAATTGRPSTTASGLAVGAAALAAALALLPATGLLYVNGPAYPDERRFPLRPPAPLLLGPIELSAAVVAGAPVVGALLVAARAWIPGAAVLVAGIPVAYVLARSLHGLSRRWVVFVPAGLVLHDPLTLVEPVLFPLDLVESLGPARAGSDSLDLRQRAAGLDLELLLREEVPVSLVTPGTPGGTPGSSARVRFTPSRPGQVLAEAATRGFPRG